jgi:acetylornithine deacetylase
MNPFLIPDAAALTDAVTAERDYMLETLTDFVACPSFSGQEEQAAEFMEGALSALGLSLRRIPLVTDEIAALSMYSPATSPDNARYSLLATHVPNSPATQRAGRTLLFNGHMDIVPTGPESLWSSAPLKARIEGDLVFGRGAGDMKAGIVCAMTALKALQRLGLQPAAKLAINTVLEEENTGNGTLACLSQVRDFDTVIIPEPFDETLMAAQVGVLWCQFELTGKPAHAAYATSGVNPIEASIAIYQEFKKLEAAWNAPQQRHPLYREHAHPINFNLGYINGGEWTSSVPCTCSMAIRVGFYPGVSVDQVKQQVAQVAERALASLPNHLSLTITHRGFHAPGCTFDLEHESMQLLAAAHEKINGAKPRAVALTATTDARFFRLDANMPVTCYGPKADNIHGVDESVSIASMTRVATVMAQFIVDWCGVEPLAATLQNTLAAAEPASPLDTARILVTPLGR